MKIKFNNQFVNELPGDLESGSHPRQVLKACYSRIHPTETSRPKILCTSESLSRQLAINPEDLNSSWFKNLFTGNLVSEEMQPYAMCYGGHQFGQWAGQLGDGRAINLGEVIDVDGLSQTLQLKGAGLTPYSRTADGLAVLRSSVREFLCSEAMHYLGIATTRALSLGLTGDQVMRDMFYDGNSALEPGAIVCRVSPSFLRFGSFQIHASRNEITLLKKLADYSITHNFPHLGQTSPEVYERWFAEICQSTLKLMVDWMRVGFVHGVMNTDNMSILGQTIDYGPYGWLEGYQPEWTPNTTDAQGRRYCYGNQPQIAHWNLFQLANAIAPLVGKVEGLEKILADYADQYSMRSQAMYAEKLGIEKHNGQPDQQLINKLFEVLQLSETDMSLFFRALARLKTKVLYNDHSLLEAIKIACYVPEDLNKEYGKELLIWLKSYLKRIEQQKLNDLQRSKKMNRVNPKYTLRNYLVQIAIDKAADGNYSEIVKLLEIIKKPYDEQMEYDTYAAKRPDWARHKAGCSMLSCSS